MPDKATVDAFIADVLTNDHAGAIERWYAEDASIQENQSAPREGRDHLIAGEKATLARFDGVETELIGGPIVDGDHVAIRWRFIFHTRDGGRVLFEEVAWQVWRGDRIWRETFFYDPAQRTVRYD